LPARDSEASKVNDLNKVRTYFTADYPFTGPDGKMVSSEERLRSLKEQGSNLVSTPGIITREYGNAGMVTGIVTTKTPSGGTEQSRFIQLRVWQAGEWMLAASQVTRIE